jgi:hypothetical protein
MAFRYILDIFRSGRQGSNRLFTSESQRAENYQTAGQSVDRTRCLGQEYEDLSFYLNQCCCLN